MKNNIKKLISSVLIFSFLLSCFTVFSFADTTSEIPEDETAAPEEDIKVLLNRDFGEGWEYYNGFTTNTKEHRFSIEYEETDDYSYNYFTRVEGLNSMDGYIEYKYDSNSATYGKTIFEIDLKTDDHTDVGTVIYTYRAESTSSKYTYPLVSIEDNNIYLIDAGSVFVDVANTNANLKNKSPAPAYLVGPAGDEWVHLAFVFSVNQVKCPTCGAVYDLTADIDTSKPICCEETEIPVSQMETLMTLTVYYGYSDTFDVENAIKANNLGTKEKDLNATYYYTATFTGGGEGKTLYKSITNVDYFRIGLPSAGVNNFGSSYLFDNVKIYNGAQTVTDISDLGYGVSVDESQAKTVEILGSDNKNIMSYINEGLAMKVGVDYCLDKNERRAILESSEGDIYGAPVKMDGKVYVPLQAVLDWVGYPMYQHEDGMSFDISTETGSTFITIGRKLATSNGELVELSAAPSLATDSETGLQYIVVSIDDIETLFDGYYVTYDAMGLIIVATADDLLNRESDLSLMLDIMKKFIYSDYSGNEIYNIVKENTNDFSHPYIIATQDDFDCLYVAYTADEGDDEYNAELAKYLADIMAEAEALYAMYATEDPETAGKYLTEEIINPHTLVEEDRLNNGYEYSAGRLEESAEYNSHILALAFAYQVSHEEKFASLAYEMAVSMGKWSHWGPAYFSSLANATTPYALAYDWLYNTWNDMGYNLSVIEQTIYEKCISQGYYAATGVECEYLSNQGDFSAYTDKTDSRNVIGTSGMVIGSLALMGAGYNMDAEGRVNETYSENYEKYSEWLIENNIKTLIDVGLDMYAPDGSYIESPQYWGYATNALFLMSWALETSMNDDLGLLETWGMDTTFYYAYQTEFSVSTDVNPDGHEYWAYHNAYLGSQATELSFYAAEAFEDSNLAVLRLNQIDTKKATIWDALAYDASFADYAGETGDTRGVALDYILESCEGIVSRSSWADGALFVGIMGNENNAVGGQIDSGNFVYANKGYAWVTDLGAEDYKTYGYSTDSRYNYYRETGEGANVISVTSVSGEMPNGQVLEAGGILKEYKTNDYGMYAIIDNSAVYGSIANDATRGLLLTNNRNTVVIQDSMNFAKSASCIWVCHTKAESVSISPDGRTAFLRQKVGELYQFVRVTLVSKDTSMQFEKSNTYNYLLDSTSSNRVATTNGCNAEMDRTGYTKLYIKSEDIIRFECAVVFESVIGESSAEEVQYEYTDLVDWNESMLVEEFVATVVDENERGNPLLTDVSTYTAAAAKILANGFAFSTQIKNFYRNMVYVAAAVKVYEPTGQIDNIIEQKKAYLEYQGYLLLYQDFRSEINYYGAVNQAIAEGLCGYYKA